MGFERTGLTLKTWARLAVLCCLGALMVVASPTVASAQCEMVWAYQYAYYSNAARTQLVGWYSVDCAQAVDSWGDVTPYYYYSNSFCGCYESGDW